MLQQNKREMAVHDGTWIGYIEPILGKFLPDDCVGIVIKDGKLARRTFINGLSAPDFYSDSRAQRSVHNELGAPYGIDFGGW
jgi:hypothetical protein